MPVSRSSPLPANQRAVITGIGPVTPCGIGKQALWNSLLAEQSPIAPLTRFHAPHARALHAAELRDFDVSAWFASHQCKRWDRCTQLIMAAAHLAVEDAGLDFARTDPTRTAISLGSALGGIADAEAQHQRYLESGPKSIHRALALQIYGGSAHGNLAIHFGIEGPALTHSNSCASSNIAIAEALRLIRLQQADIVIAGGGESPLSPLTFTAFDQIHTMSRWRGDPPSHACRPFDRARDGFVMGEGAACLVVETLAHARARNAAIYAEIAGSSLVSEAHHMTMPRPDGLPLRRAMQLALDDAALNPSDISYINAHASSTPQNDLNEATQIAALFGPHPPPLSGTKAYTGHPLGAAGAIECAIALLALQHQWLPPTLHFQETDGPAFLDYVPNHGRACHLEAILNNSFGFGGVDSCVVLRQVRD